MHTGAFKYKCKAAATLENYRILTAMAPEAYLICRKLLQLDFSNTALELRDLDKRFVWLTLCDIHALLRLHVVVVVFDYQDSAQEVVNA